MNKYEKLFDDIATKTHNGDLNWKQISKTAHADLIFNPDMSFRQYATVYKKGGKTYELVFVEKKTDDPHHDYAFQKYIPEVLVVGQNNELVTTLTDSVIDRDQMIDLVRTIEENSDSLSGLFD
ncbi:hypothetical protein [Pseudomonas sp. FR229a]|uniref:hypothetical protein n=1 Tax=Pseudomonas sp. FR229a TaxID=3040313 RepID=UPI002555D9C7|nr:hypothetical protein [Pseudomonas sp. FR229a]